MQYKVDYVVLEITLHGPQFSFHNLVHCQVTSIFSVVVLVNHLHSHLECYKLLTNRLMSFSHNSRSIAAAEIKTFVLYSFIESIYLSACDAEHKCQE